MWKDWWPVGRGRGGAHQQPSSQPQLQHGGGGGGDEQPLLLPGPAEERLHPEGALPALLPRVCGLSTGCRQPSRIDSGGKGDKTPAYLLEMAAVTGKVILKRNVWGLLEPYETAEKVMHPWGSRACG